MRRKVDNLRSFCTRASRQCQKWLAAEKMVNRLISESSGATLSEDNLVRAVQITYKTSIASSTNVEEANVAPFKYIAMEDYLAQQPKFKDVCRSGEPTDG